MYCSGLHCWQQTPCPVHHGLLLSLRCCVIGAGAAGLVAALTLAQQGVQVTVYEARDRIGGRCSRVFLGGVPIDTGAEFSHGNGCVMTWAKQAGVPEPRAMFDYHVDSVASLHAKLSTGNMLVDSVNGIHAVVEGVEEFEDDIIEDDSWETGADKSFAQVCIEQELEPEVVAALDASYAVEYATSMEFLGVRDWRRRELIYDSTQCTTDYHVQGHYIDILEHVATEARAHQANIILSHPVSMVTAETNQAKVDGESFDCVIVTVPLSVLQTEKLKLEGVSSKFRQTVQAVKCFPASKIILILSHKIWPAEEWGCMHFCGEGFAKQVWLREATNNEGELVYVAVGFLAGPRDAAVSQSLTMEEAAERFTQQLKMMYQAESLGWKEGLKVDWGQEPFIEGGYSSPTLGCYDAWRVLADTGASRVLYASEAVHEKGSSVDCAMESGVRAATRCQELLMASIMAQRS